MPARRKFEEQLASLEALREQTPESRVAALRKALGHRNNYIVAKAADLVREFRMAELIPELLAAFERFFTEPVKTDPQCWAKNALSRALVAVDYREPEVFLRGMVHIQLEPVWGGSSDTAGTLRGTCALALVACGGLSEYELLSRLADLFADKELPVRAEAARALEQTGSRSAALLLRLKALVSADEPEVLGACYSGILSIEGAAAIPWISRFLSRADDAAAEAAHAIAQQHSPEAFGALRERFALEHDPWFQSVLLSAIALTRQQAAQDFLLSLVRPDSLQAEDAMAAILRARPSPESVRQLEGLVSKTPRLARVLAGIQAKISREKE